MLAPVKAFDAAVMQRPEVVEGYPPGIERRVFGRYVVNFLFFPDDEPADTFARLQGVIDRARRLLPAEPEGVAAMA